MEQEWRSGESTRLPPMWLGFDSRTRRHMWVELVVGFRPCSERFFSGYSRSVAVLCFSQKLTFPVSSSILESEGHRFVNRNRLLSVTLVKQSWSRSLILVKSRNGIHFFGDETELTAQLEKHSHLTQKLPRQMIVSHWKTTTRSGVAIFQWSSIIVCPFGS